MSHWTVQIRQPITEHVPHSTEDWSQINTVLNKKAQLMLAYPRDAKTIKKNYSISKL